MNSFYIEQSILNAMNKAIKTMQDGGKLRIKTYAAKRPSHLFAIIAISGGGPGIAAQNSNDIMSNSNGNGRGFGFRVTHNILKRYSGYMEIDRRKDEATPFRCSSPVSKTPSNRNDKQRNNFFVDEEPKAVGVFSAIFQEEDKCDEMDQGEHRAARSGPWSPISISGIKTCLFFIHRGCYILDDAKDSG